MANKIKPKRSYTASSVPLTTDLETHELAINWADGKAFTKNAAGNIVSVTLGGGGGSGLTWSSVPASATATGTAGQIAYDASGNFYVCTATNTWVRSQLTPWELDQYFSSVSLLLRMDGSGGTFVDSSGNPKTVTAYNGATQSTANFKFGTRSLYLNGTTFNAAPYLSVPYSSAFDLSSGDWTVECWAYATALNAQNNLFAINGDGASNAQVTVIPQANGSSYFLTQGSSGDWLDTTLCPPYTFTTNTWQHVAAVRSGNVFRLYVNGTSVLSYTSSSALRNASGLSTIGARLPPGNATVGSQTWQGYIDDFRVTKGVARYSGSSFTVPTSAFQTS
jgi:Concanavalin A-like lectin/glucanases superfamily